MDEPRRKIWKPVDVAIVTLVVSLCLSLLLRVIGQLVTGVSDPSPNEMIGHMVTGLVAIISMWVTLSMKKKDGDQNDV